MLSKLQKLFNNWEKVVNSYEKASGAIQKKISKLIEDEYINSEKSKMSPDQLKELIDNSGELHNSVLYYMFLLIKL